MTRKLDLGRAREIFAARGSSRQLAAQYGISHMTVARIKTGKAWPEAGAEPPPEPELSAVSTAALESELTDRGGTAA